MEPMSMDLRLGTPRIVDTSRITGKQPGPRKRALRLAAGLIAAAVWGGGVAAAAADLSSTTVSLAGEGFTASLASGSAATFAVGAVSVSCNRSVTTGAVPTAPDNHNDAGPVASIVTNPSFGNNTSASCPTNVPFTTAVTTSNSTAGSWAISLQYNAAGSTGTLTIPQGGVVTQTSGLAACTITVAPTGGVSIPGTWVDGTATTNPRLVISSAVVPITVSGGILCPLSATTAAFSATYEITTSGSQILVAP